MEWSGALVGEEGGGGGVGLVEIVVRLSSGYLQGMGSMTVV